MTRRDQSAALLCVLVWGLNFVVIDDGLKHLPPLLFVALRFLFTALPAVFFLPRPGVGWPTVVAVGLLACVAQFGFLFVAMHDGLPAGLASVVIQSQALFTIAFAATLLRERLTRRQLIGVLLAAAGMTLVALTRTGAVPLSALALGIASGASWGAANIISRAARPTRPLSLLVYSALVAPLPLAALSLLIEGTSRDLAAIKHLGPPAIGALAFVVIAATFVGWGLWYQLLSRNDSSLVAPFGLLVPVVGLGAAWMFAGEQPSLPEVAGCTITICGLAILALTRRQPTEATSIDPVTSFGDRVETGPAPIEHQRT